MKFFIMLFTALLVTSNIQAAELTKDMKGKEFCSDLSKDKIYDQDGLTSYRKLLVGYDGWIFRDSTDYLSDFSLKRKNDPENLLRLTKAFKDKGIEFIIVQPPTRGIMHSDKVAGGFDGDAAYKAYIKNLDHLKNKGINIVGVTNRNIDNFFYPHDQHWSATGTKFVADEVAKYISKFPSYSDIEKLEFETITEDKKQKVRGAFRKATLRICEQRLPYIKVNHYKTIRKDGDLFADNKAADIILIGTSNSTNPQPSYANFEGFLKHSLKADVDNKSISGGGLDSSIMGWLASDEYKIHKPKFLIWEVPGYYNNIGSIKFIRQFIPAIYGKCSGNKIVEEVNLVTEDGDFVVFDDLSKKIDGSNYYVRFEYDKKVFKKWKAFFYYSEGRVDSLRMRREKTFPHDGVFYMQLSDKYLGGLKKVYVNLPPKLVGRKLHAQICRI